MQRDRFIVEEVGVTFGVQQRVGCLGVDHRVAQDLEAAHGLIPDLVVDRLVFDEALTLDAQHVGDDDMERARVGVDTAGLRGATVFVEGHVIELVVAALGQHLRAEMLGESKADKRLDVVHLERDPVVRHRAFGLGDHDRCRGPGVADPEPGLHTAPLGLAGSLRAEPLIFALVIGGAGGGAAEDPVLLGDVLDQVRSVERLRELLRR